MYFKANLALILFSALCIAGQAEEYSYDYEFDTTTPDSDYDQCDLCTLIVEFVSNYTDLEYHEALNKTVEYWQKFPPAEQAFMENLTSFDFHKIYYDLTSPPPGWNISNTCSDMGFCDYALGYQPWFEIHNYTHRGLTNFTSPLGGLRDKSLIVLHHTVTPTLEETIEVLAQRGLSVQYIVDVDGGIYLMVYDYYRAWHAGRGIWNADGCQVNDTNQRSVGIEVVNPGDTPFPKAQVEGIHKLVKYLQVKWHVLPQNIIAHHENQPDNKYDISGYFDWKDLYDYLNVFQYLWLTDIPPERRGVVLLDEEISKEKEAFLHLFQQKLFSHGYGGVVVGDPYSSSNSSVVTTAMAVQSFNRKFVPELFYKEHINGSMTVVDPRNQRVYLLTEDRMDKMLQLYQNETLECTNYYRPKIEDFFFDDY